MHGYEIGNVQGLRQDIMIICEEDIDCSWLSEEMS